MNPEQAEKLPVCFLSVTFMFKGEFHVRVRYAETDQMGYVYYGNYATYYEIARTEVLRQLGISYKSLEEQEGVMLPVLENYSKYLKPALYDDNLRIEVSIPEKPAVRITFSYEVFNESDTLINTGNTTLVFVSKETGRPCMIPDRMMQLLEPYYSDERKG